MATDDERREVAERLRDVARAVGGPLGDIGFTEAMHRALGGGGWHDMTERLADLIDPDCEEGRYSVARTARPVDRDALLALADEIEDNDLTYCVSTQYVLDGYASRIREACGHRIVGKGEPTWL